MPYEARQPAIMLAMIEKVPIHTGNNKSWKMRERNMYNLLIHAFLLIAERHFLLNGIHDGADEERAGEGLNDHVDRCIQDIYENI